MSASTSKLVRQWVAMPGGSCDLRVGSDAIEAMGTILKGSVGRPRTCALVKAEDASEEIVERVRRQLTDAGFLVQPVSLPAEGLRTLGGVELLSSALSDAHVTADDLVCAVGSADLLSTCSFVCSSWCSGTPLAHVPLDLQTSIEVTTTPLGIDVGGSPQMFASKLSAKYAICDLSAMDVSPDTTEAVYSRALMATAALCDSEKAVERLWDRAELLVDGDIETLQEQIADTAKSRGHIISSTSIAMRQSVSFGQTFMRALSTLVGEEVPKGLLLAEGVRFQSRIAAATEILPVEEVLMMDELLDLLGLEPVSCEVDADAMVAALKEECFLRSNRFMLCLPRGAGRIRPASVDEEVLREHAEAWCASRAQL